MPKRLPKPVGQNVGGVLQSEVTRSYNSFSGSDIRCQIGNYSFAEVQAVSYSITREKAPIYTMGSPDPRAFSRNKRGIAGSLVWVNFDRHALLNLVYQLGGQFVANVDDLKPQFMTNQSAFLSQTAIFQSTLIRDSGQSAGATIDQFDGQPVSAVSGFKEVASPWYSDQILPFDITLAGTNEEGAASAMKITGVEVLNEGTGVSINDAVTETQCSFVAREVQPWQAVTSPLVVSLLFRLKTSKLIRCRLTCHLKLQNPVFTQ